MEMTTICCPPDLVNGCGKLMEDNFFKAFIDESRLKIFLILMERGEMTVNEVSGQITINQSNVSRHLTFLKRVGLALTRKEGRKTYYRINYQSLAHRLQSILSIVRACCPPEEEKRQ